MAVGPIMELPTTLLLLLGLTDPPKMEDKWDRAVDQLEAGFPNAVDRAERVRRRPKLANEPCPACGMG